MACGLKFNKMLKSFIGPLGDDIPSIFPIVFAVLLFGGTVIYANQLISQKALALQVREGAVSLSYLVTEKGFIDAPTLALTCEQKVKPRAASLGVKYLITLKRFCNGIPADASSTDPALNPYSQNAEATYVARSTADGDTWEFCSNDDAVNQPAQLGHKFNPPQQSASLSFPIAVPCPDTTSFTSGLGMVNVITWK